MSYRRAESLDTFVAEVDAAAPGRSKLSDGWIGDAAHASRDSDHNPWVRDTRGVGVVRAQDITHDPADGVDCNILSQRVAALLGKHPALKSGAYVIWNRRIISADRLSEGWRYYSGSNPHDKHMHVSVALALAGYDSTTPWNVMEEEDPMADPKIQAQLDRIEEAVEAMRTNSRKRDLRVIDILKKVRHEVKDDATRKQLDAAVEQLSATQPE